MLCILVNFLLCWLINWIAGDYQSLSKFFDIVYEDLALHFMYIITWHVVSWKLPVNYNTLANYEIGRRPRLSNHNDNLYSIISHLNYLSMSHIKQQKGGCVIKWLENIRLQVVMNATWVGLNLNTHHCNSAGYHSALFYFNKT